MESHIGTLGQMLIDRTTQEAIVGSHTSQQIEATACKGVIFIRIGISQRLQIEVTNPQSLVALRAILIDGLHTLGQSLQANIVNLLDDRRSTLCQLRHRACCRRLGLEIEVGKDKVVVRFGQKLNLHIAASQSALHLHLGRHTHNGNNLILQPRTAQATRWQWIKRSVKLAWHLGKGEFETYRGIGWHIHIEELEREVARIVVAQVEDNLLARLERLFVEHLYRFASWLHTPPLKCALVGHRAHDGNRLDILLGELGDTLGGFLQPAVTLVGPA